MAGPHDKVRSVRLTGGRLSGEHQRGAKTSVVISGVACPDCGSTLVRISRKGDTCEGCKVKARREKEEQQKAQRTLDDCRQQAANASLGKIVKMLEINMTALDRHRASLRKSSTASYAIQQIIVNKTARSQKFVDIWTVALKEKLSSNSDSIRLPGRDHFDARRKTLLSEISAGKLRTVDALADPSLQELLHHTYALSLLVNQYGAKSAVSAFRSASLPLTIPCIEKWREGILQVNSTLASPAKRKKIAPRAANPAERAKTRADHKNAASSQLLKRIERGTLSLESALKSSLRSLGRCRLHDVIDALSPDLAVREKTKRKLGGTSNRKLQDLSVPEVARLVRLSNSRKIGN